MVSKRSTWRGTASDDVGGKGDKKKGREGHVIYTQAATTAKSSKLISMYYGLKAMPMDA